MDSTIPAPMDNSGTGPPIRVDARPILRRTQDNPWDRTEQLRSRLDHLIEETCLNLGLEAMVLQSDPYVHPAWVKVEAWKPEREGALTARSWMTVSITAMPYHLYEAVYRVEWEKQGRHGVTDHLYAFRENEIKRMLRFLLAEPGVPLFGEGPVRWILSNVQLRTEWWHLWKPKNKVVALRPNLVRAGSGLLVATGALVMLGGFGSLAGRPYDSGGYEAGIYDTTVVTTVPGTDTVATFMFPDTLMATVPTTDSVVTSTVSVDTIMAPPSLPSTRPIYAGQETTEALDFADPVFSDINAHYDDWRYIAYQAERIRVTMSSSNFQPSVSLGRLVEGRWTALEASNVTFNDGTTLQVEVLLPESGEYVIAAGSRLPNQTGGYSLRLDRLGGT